MPTWKKRAKAVVCIPFPTRRLRYSPAGSKSSKAFADSHTANYSYTKPEYPSQYPTGDRGSSSKKTSKKDSKKKSKKGKEKVDYDEEEEEQQEDDDIAPDDDNPHLPQGMACFGLPVHMYLTLCY